jgi:hypothetical protein
MRQLTQDDYVYIAMGLDPAEMHELAAYNGSTAAEQNPEVRARMAVLQAKFDSANVGFDPAKMTREGRR